MTEAEWLACGDPAPMLEFLRGQASERKLRLFAVACCRAAWNRFADPRSTRAVLLLERAADEPPGAGREEAATLAERAQQEVVSARRPGQGSWEVSFAVAAARACQPDAHRSAAEAARWAASAAADVPDEQNTPFYAAEELQAEKAHQARLLGDIVGTPGRAAAVRPAWRTADVITLARAAYAGRAFDRLPILSDALEEAGCADDALLSHLRSPGPHVRGCWALDLVLGKS